MSASSPSLPDGFALRLHDDVTVGSFLVSDTRVARISPAAREMLRERGFIVDSPASSVLARRLLDLDLADPVLNGLSGPGLDRLTVVVPVRDHPRGVDRLLHALGGYVTCVVVDDASTESDALAGVVGRHRARLVRLDVNVGPAAARMAGLHDVTTPFVAFVDADVEVSPAVLRDLMRQMVDPGLAAVAPRVLSRGTKSNWLDRYEDAAGSLDLGPVSATARPWSAVSFVPSACLVVRVAALGDGFDVTMRCGEDVDLMWRVQKAGHRVAYVADLLVHHDTRSSFVPWIGRKAFYGSSAAPLASRHGDVMAPATYSWIGAATMGALVLQRRWSVVGAGVGALIVTRNMASSLSDVPRRDRLRVIQAMWLGMGKQTSGLALRHWAPVSVVLALASGRYRRLLLVAAVVDGVLAHRASSRDLDPVRFTLARRAEHIAYGAGVWWGAVKERSARCLVPRWIQSRPGRSRP